MNCFRSKNCFDVRALIRQGSFIYLSFTFLIFDHCLNINTVHMCCSDGSAWGRYGIANEKMVQTLKRYRMIYESIRKPVPKKKKSCIMVIMLRGLWFQMFPFFLFCLESFSIST